VHSPVADSHTFALPAITADPGATATLSQWVLKQTADDADSAQAFAPRHYDRDLEAMQIYRPGYEFWRHVFTIPNGRMAFGSAADGSLLATFPLAQDDTAQALEQAAGPVVSHETRGTFIADGTGRYGTFLAEWGAIFERFGVPAEIGLAQGLTESGVKGRVRSEAGAIGFCQWLPRNWARLQSLTPHVIEADNQTTQVPYCAAHLAVLSTKYGSFIPALSEHHAGGVNVGRTMINGDFAGGEDARARYFLGAELTLLVRQVRPPGYSEVVGGYGPRSYRYAEMVFGNTLTIAELEAAMTQERIFAMRPGRDLGFDEVVNRTGLSADEIRRFNPALVNRVPAGANLYLPFHVEDFGRDTAFWQREPAPEYTDVLSAFLRLDERFALEDWHDGSAFEALRAFAARFRATGTEEGTVMAAVIAYAIEDLSDGRQMEILTEVRSSERARELREYGIRRREALVEAAEEGGGGWARRNALLAGASRNL
jgi:hypothetical protein